MVKGALQERSGLRGDCTVPDWAAECFRAQREEGEVKFYVDFMLWDRFHAVDPHRIEAK